MAPIRHRGPRRGRTSARGTNPEESFASSRLEDSIEATNSLAEDEELELSEAEQLASDEDESEEEVGPQKAYSALLQSFGQVYEEDGPRRKRRRLNFGKKSKGRSSVVGDRVVSLNRSESGVSRLKEIQPDQEAEAPTIEEEEEDVEEAADVGSQDSEAEEVDEDENQSDPFAQHFGSPDGSELNSRVKTASESRWSIEKREVGSIGKSTFIIPEDSSMPKAQLESSFKMPSDLPLKQKLKNPANELFSQLDDLQRTIAGPIFRYSDLLFGTRTTSNAANVRLLTCLHALNHILKTRDRVLKNNAKIARDADDGTEFRDQGFTRPKVLMLVPTRHSCVRIMKTIIELSQPDQQENRKRFEEQYAEAEEKNMDDKEDDFRELFEGNDDDMFRLGIKFTRKTIKFFAQFYNADLIIASPLGLRRAIESVDKKKGGDYDFLSSIELAIIDQADALLMQNWDHVTTIFSHLNLQPREAHGCDFSRVRPWYLDGHAKYLRQTLIFSAFITPELNALFSQHCHNVYGKLKFAPEYPGAILSITQSGLQIKQTFSRFVSTSLSGDPEQRFKFFTSSIVPSLTRYPTPPDGARGILIFIPSYFDFVRVRNYFATSSATQNISFGAISENGTPQDKEVRRARSHFLSGRHAVLLYSGRAHHFFRYRLRGVKKLVCYGLPDNDVYYQELVGMMGRSVEDGRVGAGEGAVRALFSRYDALKLERVVGSSRIGSMLKSKSDTFQFT